MYSLALREVQPATAHARSFWQNRMKLNVRFLNPHHAFVLGRPMRRISFPYMLAYTWPKTYSTRALILDCISSGGWLGGGQHEKRAAMSDIMA